MSIQALSYVLEHSEAQYGARCMMVAIANHTDESGENCWASVSTLAHEARLSRRGAQEALAVLREEGEIEAMGTSRRQTIVYRIVGMASDLEQIPLVSPKRGSADSAQADQGGAESSTGGAQNDDKRGARSAPKPLRTVHRTDTPQTPRKRGARQRDRERLQSDLDSWAAENFPAYPTGAVLTAIFFVEKRGEVADVEAVQAELERMPVEPMEAAA